MFKKEKGIELLSYSRFKMIYSIRKPSDLTAPKVINQEAIVFPKASMVIWLDHTFKFIPESHKDLLINAVKPTLFFSDRIITPIGNVKRNTIKTKSLIGEYKSFDKDIKFISEGKSLITPLSSLLIANTSLINDMLKYKTSQVLIYEKIINKIKASIEVINNGVLGLGRQRYLTLELPLNIPKFTDMEKYIKYTPKKILSLSHDGRFVQFLELYKLISNKSSIFDSIDKDSWKLVELVFTFKNKFILINLEHFIGINKDREIENNIKEVSSNNAKKTFLVMCLSLMINEGLSETELEDPKKIDIQKNFLEQADGDIDKLLDNLEEDQVIIDDLEEVKDPLVGIKVKSAKELMTKRMSPKEVTTRALDIALSRGEITETRYKKHLQILEDQKDIMKELEFNPSEFILEDKDKNLPDSPLVYDKSIQKKTVKAMKQKYMRDSHDKNILRTIYGIQSSGHMVTGVNKVEVKDPLGDYLMYAIDISNVNGNVVKLNMKVPKLDIDGIWVDNGNDYIMRSLRGDTPIKKTSPTNVLLTGYERKLHIHRDKYSKDNLGKSLLGKLKGNDKVFNLIEGDSFTNLEHLSYWYTNMSKSIKSFNYGEDKFSLIYDGRVDMVNKGDVLDKVEDGKTLIGKRGKGYLLLDVDNILYLKNSSLKPLGNFLTYLDISVNDIPPQVANINIANKVIPLIFMLMQNYTLSQIIKMTGVKFRRVEETTRVKLEDNEFPVKFNDGTFIFSRERLDLSLLFAGLTTIKQIKDMNIRTFDSIHGLGNIISLMGLGKRVLTDIKNVSDLFLDPITITILEHMGEPTSLDGLYLRSLELLTEDYAPDTTDLDHMRMLGNERIAGLIYRELSIAIKSYENKKSTSRAKIAMSPYALWSTINSDSTTVIVDDLNPFTLNGQYNEITYSGVGGRSKETMNRETRSYHKSDFGVISGDVKDNSDVGISMEYTADPIMDGLTGLKKKGVKEFTVANTTSNISLLYVDNDKDDPKRFLNRSA